MNDTFERWLYWKLHNEKLLAEAYHNLDPARQGLIHFGRVEMLNEIITRWKELSEGNQS